MLLQPALQQVEKRKGCAGNPRPIEGRPSAWSAIGIRGYGRQPYLGTVEALEKQSRRSVVTANKPVEKLQFTPPVANERLLAESPSETKRFPYSRVNEPRWGPIEYHSTQQNARE